MKKGKRQDAGTIEPSAHQHADGEAIAQILFVRLL